MSIDVEALEHAMEDAANSLSVLMLVPADAPAIAAEYARLVPAEDEGHFCFCPYCGHTTDVHDRFDGCGAQDCQCAIPMAEYPPAEDEGRLREAAWFEGYQAAVRDIRHKRPLAATPEPLNTR